MSYKCYFYARDGFVLERDIEDLEPKSIHQRYFIATYQPILSLPLNEYTSPEPITVKRREFRCIANFKVSSQKIAYYEEV